ISDLTSVAIDPSTRGQLYTTQAGTGAAVAPAPLQWVSQGLTGPGNLGIPTAGEIRTGTPNAAAAPPTLYRAWRYANANPPTPETWIDGGNTWSPVGTKGIPTNNNPAGFFPVFTVNQGQGDNSLDQLLFGTALPFLSNTSGQSWSAVPSSRDADPNNL